MVSVSVNRTWRGVVATSVLPARTASVPRAALLANAIRSGRWTISAMSVQASVVADPTLTEGFAISASRDSGTSRRANAASATATPSSVIPAPADAWIVRISPQISTVTAAWTATMAILVSVSISPVELVRVQEQ